MARQRVTLRCARCVLCEVLGGPENGNAAEGRQHKKVVISAENASCTTVDRCIRHTIVLGIAAHLYLLGDHDKFCLSEIRGKKLVSGLGSNVADELWASEDVA